MGSSVIETKRTRSSSFSARTRLWVRASCAVTSGHASAHVVKTKLTTTARPSRLSDFTTAPACSTSDAEVEPHKGGEGEEEVHARPRELEAPHRDTEDRMTASVLENRLAPDEDGGVRHRRREPDDAARVLPRRVEPDVVRGAAETADQDPEDQRLIDGEHGQGGRGHRPSLRAGPRRERPQRAHGRGSIHARPLSSRTWASTRALRAMNSGVAMTSAGRGRVSFTGMTSRIWPGRAVMTATRSVRKIASSMSWVTKSTLVFTSRQTPSRSSCIASRV